VARPMANVERRLVTSLRAHPKNAAIYGDDADDDLVSSVRERGVLAPLLITHDGLIIAGHRRWSAARAAGLADVPVVEFGSRDENEILSALLESNRQRVKTEEQTVREYRVWLEVEAWFARQRQVATLKQNAAVPADLRERSGEASAFAADRVGRKPRTMEKGRQVVEAIDALEARGGTEMAEDIRSELNEKSVDAAHRMAQAWGLLIKPEPPAAQDDGYPLLTLSAWRALSAAEQRRQLARPRSPTFKFNDQSSTKIEWAEWSWNPVTGCKHDCSYCYARDIALGRGRIAAFPQGFEPTFLPERLAAPRNTKVPAQASQHIGLRNVFTCSMADLFGKWVPHEWIDAVLAVVRENPQWNFLFLTKFPQRLTEFDFPENAWVGTTVDAQARVKLAEDAFARVRATVRWLSIEPLLEPLVFEHLEHFDWLAIGGASASSETPAWHPPLSWVADLEHQAHAVGAKVYHKSNLYQPRHEYPGALLAEPVQIADVFHMRYLQRDVLEPRKYAAEMKSI
jgi:protein gp37/ParB-like chromosome segregation protein Spo0J